MNIIIPGRSYYGNKTVIRTYVAHLVIITHNKLATLLNNHRQDKSLMKFYSFDLQHSNYNTATIILSITSAELQH